MGLVTRVGHCRFGRHSPTELLARKRGAHPRGARASEDAFTRRLGEEGLSPEVLRSEDGVVLVRFGSGGKHVVLDVPLDPYMTAWKSEP